MIRRCSSCSPLTLLSIPVCCALLYAALMPLAFSSATWVACAALLLGIAIVTVNTANNTQPTGSLGQLLYGTESPRRRAANRTRPVSKW